MSTPLPREDLVAAMAARRELGPDYDDAFVESLADRIEETLRTRMAIQQREDHRVARTADRQARSERGSTLALAIVSLVAAVPLSGIGAGTEGLAGLLTVWIGIVLVNVAFAVRSRIR
ncbi:hypothetical protein GCM10009678_59330 [Actinomadura kijaniata]|uniref:Integral membrane protein n=1 Tax=Actinomadura namibiensis TaxID=182080 RepID=A0A7W3LVQ8_ACTNM|nr:hypothetical protein [Actinomadura namibiensis]MBA8955131.1 hypothetical protein [Actinomadura namibiensis]